MKSSCNTETADNSRYAQQNLAFCHLQKLTLIILIKKFLLVFCVIGLLSSCLERSEESSMIYAFPTQCGDMWEYERLYCML